MRAKRSSLLVSRHSRTSRWLSCALLLFFAFASTAEAVHHHGLVTQNTPATAASTSAVSNSDLPSTPRKSGSGAECLVCQFQQNLSSAEIFTPLVLSAPLTSDQQFVIPTVRVGSVSTKTPHGRGPPSIS